MTAVAHMQRDPLAGIDAVFSIFDKSWATPNIIEFVVGKEWLNSPGLYPRQGTLLKILTLQVELLTPYDYGVIAEWESEYIRTADEKGEGNEGIVPGVLDRVMILRECPCGHDRGSHTDEGWPEPGTYKDRACRECVCVRYQGRKWFREAIVPIGRRGGKGHIGAMMGAYIIWDYINKGDPQSMYGIAKDKRLTTLVFGGKKEQAKANQWADLNNIITMAPCFEPYICKPLAESLTLFSEADLVNLRERRARGLVDNPSFEIIPKESSQMAGRGPASMLLYFDEAAHVVKGVANVEAQVVYDGATPSLDQFGKDTFIYTASSPWQRIGMFHNKYQEAIELDENGNAVYPEMIMIQLPSWGPYVDWESAHEIPMWPGGPNYQRLKGAIQNYDHQMQQIERANPETFKVERRAHFAAVLDAYLNPDRIKTIWEPWPEDNPQPSVWPHVGQLNITYRMHGDPSKSGAAFGLAIAHVGGEDERGLPHVVFDLIHSWRPEDYENHEVDYGEIQDELADMLDRFMPTAFSLDQFSSTQILQNLRKHVIKRKYPKRVQVYERTATGPLNWKTYETFKTALGLGLVHSPVFHEQANLELTYLQDLGGKVDCPESGPVQTKDIADCMAIITYDLIGDKIGELVGKTLSDLNMGGGMQGGIDAYQRQRDEVHQALSAFTSRNRIMKG